ncbi:DUF551 domain-containing protein [Citrobacter sp. RHBSTW-00599]|uniref:DUF551 domain-containing protein n=1 Tax=Citrobacter sp. RHBSTW-00599 TaxID=2742657 RepID=UPI0020181E2C|nr:DUF551 domain-containing protein [Citrobacter sp. RHBSTW-00599]
MTTNNHPAHGHVSLDRLHQIREILSKAAAQSDGGNLGYAMADAVKVIDGVISAEPVGEVSEQCDGLVMDGTVELGGASTHRIIKGASKMKRLPIGTKFYTAPPAPVVPLPDVVSVLLNHLEDVLPDDAFNLIDVKAWNAVSMLTCPDSCRAAMLQAGNSPVTPGGWIPVSERMPEDSSDVLCTAEFDGPGDWRKKVGYWHEGKWVVYGASWTPTHWMPLPNPPKEEN